MNPVNPQIEESWKRALEAEFKSEYFLKLRDFLQQEKSQKKIIYPAGNQIFAAFDATPFHEVKVVILGQDPYHGAGQAHGLCFSVQEGVAPPPSLVNVYKELKADLGFEIPKHGNLLKWAQQGVLLLNATLTVRANEAGSHQKRGWEHFTDAAIKTLSEGNEKIVFLLWGRYAQAKEVLIDTEKHFVLKAAHPSPLSAYNGFFGCRHFSKANEILKSCNKEPVNWQL
ncbi:MAG: uracil-DNA glycosylase [Bacteroidia bacterium]